MDIAIELLEQEAGHLLGYDPQDWRGKRLAAVEAELAQLRNTGTELTTPQELTDQIATNLRETRRQTMQIARGEGFPGLQGISRKAGAESVSAILLDVTRNVAQALADARPDFSWADFMTKADPDKTPEVRS